MKQKTKLMVSGGAGFIASHFIEYQFEHYDDVQVLNIDSLTYASNMHNNDMVAKNPDYHFEYCDIADRQRVDAVMHEFQPNYIIHAAAETHVDNSLNSRFVRDFVNTNIMGTLNLLEAAKHYAPDLKKFVQVSTDEIFGEVLIGSTNEDASYCPRNPYSATKAGAEHIVFSYVESNKMPAIVTRTTNNYGKYQHEEKYIPHSVIRLLQGKPITIFGTGSQVREWIHAVDHSRGIDRVMRLENDISFSYNIPGGTSLSNYELAQMICEYMQKDPEKNIIYETKRPYDDQRYSLSSKYYHLIDPKPQNIPFEVGLIETIEWYKQKFMRRQYN